MATKKIAVVDQKLIDNAEKLTAENPQPTRADINFLKGLKRRGYSEQQIIAIAKTSGFNITAEQIQVKPKKKKEAAPVARAS